MAEYQFPTGLSFERDVQGTQPTTDDDSDYKFPTGLSFAPEEKPKEAGIWAHAKKGWSDMLDYSAISLQGLGYALGGPDEDVIASNIASIEERARNTITSESHKAILDLFRKEGRDVDEAEGFVQTSKEILDMVGKGALAAITHPQGMAEFTASQLGMQLSLIHI